MREEGPCDLCKYEKECHEINCPFGRYNKLLECNQDKCFLNYDGACKVNAYDTCGARMTIDDEKPKPQW